MEDFCNAVNLCGTLAGRPVFSHNSKNEEFYTFPLEIVRLSGNADIINILADKRLLDSVEICAPIIQRGTSPGLCWRV